MPQYEPNSQDSLRAVDLLQSYLISHQIGLVRYSSTLVKKVVALLNQTEDRLGAKLIEQLLAIGEVTTTNYPRKARRLALLLEKLKELRQEAWDEAHRVAEEELLGLAQAEVGWSQTSLQQSIGIALDIEGLTLSRVEGIVKATPFQGRPLQSWFSRLASEDQERLEVFLRQALVEGQTGPEMVQAIRGTRAAKYTDGLLQISRNHADALVRTAVNHVGNQIREDVWLANADIIAGVRWLSVLDGRTTDICRSLDGAIAPLPGLPDNFPKTIPRIQPLNRRPPAHYRCRSLVVAVLDTDGIMDKIGNRPFVRTVKGRAGREVDFRQQAQEEVGSGWSRLNARERDQVVKRVRDRWATENIGQVPADTTYSAWFQQQPAAFQRQVLGPSRYKLYTKGNLSLDRFVDYSNGKPYTLPELKLREQQAFEKSGI